MRLEVLPVLGIGEVTEGDDLAALIAVAAPWLRDGDVLVVTSKIVSKAEGRLVHVPESGPERDVAREAVLTAETARPVARRGNTRIVRTHHGFVMASAGIDASNVDRDRLVLLPKDPDASARALRAGLRERHGADVAVIVSDTMGRPWRNGLTDVALGVAGMGAIRDHRGEVDPYGNELHVTQMAVVDELAGAAELVKGKCDGVPVAVVRGYPWSSATEESDQAGASVLVRDAEQDLFPLGSAEARAEGLRAAATLADTLPQPHPHPHPQPHPQPSPADPVAISQAVGRAIAAVADAVAPGTVFAPVAEAEVRRRRTAELPDFPAAATGMVRCTPPGAEGARGAAAPDPAVLIRFGADVHRLRAALAAEGIASTMLAGPTGTTSVSLAY